MNTSAAVRGLFRIPRAGPPLRWIEAGEDAAPRCDWDARVESIRNVLRQCGHSVTQLSAATRRRYGSSSQYFIPATFLYKIRSGVTPHACQIVALSESTGYRFVDWLRIFGFDLQQVPRLQRRLHTARTVLVTPNEDWLQSPYSHDGVWSASSRARPERWNRSGRYLFAQIGTGDALACPMLMPGTVVRVDHSYASRISEAHRTRETDFLWLVEQPSGLTCCQVRWIDDRQIVLLPARPPWGRWPLRLPTEARILGLVDMDVCPMKLPSSAGQLESGPLPPYAGEGKMSFSDLLRISRARAGLTFRAAHGLTRTIAQILGSQEYVIALGQLSDYEAMGKLPRHIAKILSLCIIYCMDIRDLMEAAGVSIDDSAKLPLPIPDRRPQIRSDLQDHAVRHGTDGGVTRYAHSAAGQGNLLQD